MKTDYLISGNSYATATGVSKMMDKIQKAFIWVF